MSIASNTLSHLQAAGMAVHIAAEALQQELQSHSQALMEQMALQPFGVEADGAYQQMRQVARLAHEINSLEQQLSAIYQEASQVVAVDTPVLPALPSARRGRRIKPAVGGDSVQSRDIEDASVVEGKLAVPKVPRNVSKRPLAKSTNGATLPNADRLLRALQKILKGKVKPVGHAEMAQVSGLPRGSVGASIKKLLETEKLAIDDDGAFRLI
ncbi:hypothetical protein [Curvibacter lanceolatus]|uniref:hypothetical protein n=1 Tax=Curvibacter lanceolatus TaxID=86182 RepID=UPI0012FB88B6|nr:hypothetical protein [Curvibacter lanceolatus]